MALCYLLGFLVFFLFLFLVSIPRVVAVQSPSGFGDQSAGEKKAERIFVFVVFVVVVVVVWICIRAAVSPSATLTKCITLRDGSFLSSCRQPSR